MDALPDQPTRVRLLELAREVARSCGRLIIDERPAHLGVMTTKSSPTDIVTSMDARSEDLAQRLISHARPRDGLLGEEGLRRPSASGITWLVDPIDGTVNYLYGLGYYSVSVAAVVGDPGEGGHWRPVAGAVFNPAAQELFGAALDGGATLATPSGTRQLQANRQDDLAMALVGTGFNYIQQIRAAQGILAGELLGAVRDIRRMGGAALDLCSVAAGRMDAFYEQGLNPWDMAAGWLVASEAGALVTGLRTDYPDFAMTLAGPAELVGKLRTLIRTV
jgi:myo-inositol-1(or 4)-monophosphatase